MPLAPPVIQGLINLRGQIVTAIDLRQRLELPERAKDKPEMKGLVDAVTTGSRAPEGQKCAGCEGKGDGE